MIIKLLCGLIAAYQPAGRALFGPRCRFYPSCSDYARQALEQRGLLAGLGLAALRLLKCHPLHPGGVDPVPQVHG